MMPDAMVTVGGDEVRALPVVFFEFKTDAVTGTDTKDSYVSYSTVALP
jgi:hypothetical protein